MSPDTADQMVLLAEAVLDEYVPTENQAKGEVRDLRTIIANHHRNDNHGNLLDGRRYWEGRN